MLEELPYNSGCIAKRSVRPLRLSVIKDVRNVGMKSRFNRLFGFPSVPHVPNGIYFVGVGSGEIFLELSKDCSFWQEYKNAKPRNMRELFCFHKGCFG